MLSYTHTNINRHTHTHTDANTLMIFKLRRYYKQTHLRYKQFLEVYKSIIQSRMMSFFPSVCLSVSPSVHLKLKILVTAKLIIFYIKISELYESIKPNKSPFVLSLYLSITRAFNIY